MSGLDEMSDRCPYVMVSRYVCMQNGTVTVSVAEIEYKHPKALNNVFTCIMWDMVSIEIWHIK